MKTAQQYKILATKQYGVCSTLEKFNALKLILCVYTKYAMGINVCDSIWRKDWGKKTELHLKLLNLEENIYFILFF